MTDSKVSKVYFANLRARGTQENKSHKLERLFKAAGFGDFIKKNELCAIKLHFGERGCDTFLNPVFARAMVQQVKAAGAKPFLTDTNTLYKGGRHNAVDHLTTALQHGFSYATVEAPLIIADGLKGASYVEVEINGKHFKKIKVAEAVANAGSMIVLSHFKGHIVAGFGGAIKNLAMGCSPARGKREQHTRDFVIKADMCASCGQCLANCPEEAIEWVRTDGGKHAAILKERCVACGECMTVCTHKAVEMDWDKGLLDFTERVVEYAHGVALCQTGRVGYVNFLLNITPDCDCVSWSDAPMVPDLGIMASLDPVALDKACFDLVNAQQGFRDSHLSCNHAPGEDKFKGAWEKTMGEAHFEYAQRLGLGLMNYTLIEV